MRHIKKYRGNVTHKEIVADLIFLSLGVIISWLALFVFDIHWSLYPGETLFPPSKTVGISSSVYLSGIFIGTIAIFFIIKLFLVGVREELK